MHPVLQQQEIEAQEEALSGSADAYFSDVSPDFDTIVCNYGIEAARAKVNIDQSLPELVRSPEILKQCIENMFVLTEGSQQLSIIRSLAWNLDKKSRDDLAQNGL